MDVLGRVYEEHIPIGCGLGSYEVGGLGDSGRKKTVVNSAILLGGKNMRADREVVIVAVYELERKHGGCGDFNNTRLVQARESSLTRRVETSTGEGARPYIGPGNADFC